MTVREIQSKLGMGTTTEGWKANTMLILRQTVYLIPEGLNQLSEWSLELEKFSQPVFNALAGREYQRKRILELEQIQRTGEHKMGSFIDSMTVTMDGIDYEISTLQKGLDILHLGNEEGYTVKDFSEASTKKQDFRHKVWLFSCPQLMRLYKTILADGC